MNLKVNKPECEVFNDGILTIVTKGYMEDLSSALNIKRGSVYTIYLDPESHREISLRDIVERYPNVKIVIYDEPLVGKVYRYGNRNTDEWEVVGNTVGYA